MRKGVLFGLVRGWRLGAEMEGGSRVIECVLVVRMVGVAMADVGSWGRLHG